MTDLHSYTRETRTGTQVLVHVQRDAARAPTALLLGWLGARPRPLGKYAALFHRMGYHTVQAVVPPPLVLSLSQAGAARAALELMYVLAEGKGGDARGEGDEQAEEVPRLCAGGVVVLAFSNGGATVVPKLAALFRCAAEGQGAVVRPGDVVSRMRLAPADVRAVAHVRDALAAVVFDSGPCYLTVRGGANALAVAMGVRPDSLVGRLMYLAFGAYVGVQRPIYGNFSVTWWETMRQAAYPCPEMYLYSTVDDLLDYEQLDGLIAHRREVGGAEDVRAWRVEDAPHVGLLLKHRAEYVKRIEAINDWGVNQLRQKRGMPAWELPSGGK